MWGRPALLGLLMTAFVVGDVYMHSPRGSNDRNCEKNENRQNGNRLFDSQNNGKGGYACPRPRVEPTEMVDQFYFYTGSKVVVEWTNQHGCGRNPRDHCDVVIQYACEGTSMPLVLCPCLWGPPLVLSVDVLRYDRYPRPDGEVQPQGLRGRPT
jgi:hypothetical protein